MLRDVLPLYTFQVAPTSPPQEVTLDGTQPVHVLDQRRRFPTAEQSKKAKVVAQAMANGSIISHGSHSRASVKLLRPMELLTFRAGLRLP